MHAAAPGSEVTGRPPRSRCAQYPHRIRNAGCSGISDEGYFLPSLSVRSTRNVMSSRFPIGVAHRYSVPVI